MITVKELRHMGQQRTNVTKDNLSNLSTTFSVANIFSVSLSCNSFYFFPDFLASFMAFQPFLRFFTKFLDPSSWFLFFLRHSDFPHCHSNSSQLQQLSFCQNTFPFHSSTQNLSQNYHSTTCIGKCSIIIYHNCSNLCLFRRHSSET